MPKIRTTFLFGKKTTYFPKKICIDQNGELDIFFGVLKKNAAKTPS
jgi:hypothetical protein